MNIFELTEEMKNLEMELEENGGELTPEMEQKYCLTKDAIASKVDAYACFFNKKKAEIDTINAEIARLTSLKRTATNSYDNAKSFFLNAMRNFDTDRIEGSHCKMYTTRRNSIEIVDEAKLTTEAMYKVNEIRQSLPKYIKIDVSVAKKELGDYTKENGMPDGCLPKTTVSLVVK